AFWRQFEEEERRKEAEAQRRTAAQEAEARRQAVLRQLEEEERRRAELDRAIKSLAADEARRTQAEQRAREAQQLADKLEHIRESRESRYQPPHTLGGPAAGDDDWPGREVIHRTRVTVLLVMAPGTRGIRRFNKTADPM